MRGVALWFFVSGVIYVSLGMMFGLWMAVSHDYTLAPMHAHLNLVGWVTMALFGIFYHLVPAAAERPLVKLHFIVATLGVWIMVPGIGLAIMGETEALAAVGSLLTLGSILIFLYTVAMQPRSGNLPIH
jgi:cbb3-type cytochrome oxidase subunit 1